jgi:multiple sugar transport system ATP-binding protein
VAEISMDGVGKTYPDGTVAVKNVDLAVEDNSLMVLVGPSGCGKTTLLRMVAGLEDITSGSIRIGDRVVNEVAPKDRDIAMVFQNYALYPHMSVYDNMAYGLKLRKTGKSEIKRLVTETSEILGLRDLLDKKPRQLSGGQRQRVAMGRAIVRQPKAFLMDEPLSNLDAKLRVQMRTEISRIQRQVGVTTIYVTHDQTEAMTMGDLVAVMRGGQVQQVASPQELYDHPTNLFVGGFIGSPAMNLVEATLESAGDDDLDVVFGSFRLRLPRSATTTHSGLARYVGERLIVGIRPELFEDATVARGVPQERRVSVQIELREAMGSEVYAYFRVDAPPVVTDEIKEIAEDAGDVARDDLERAAREETTSFVARLSTGTDVREGRPAELVVDTSRLHFFQLDGTAIGNGTH